MNDLTVTHTDMPPLHETGELIKAPEYRQQEAAQALFRTRLLREMLELQHDLMSISCAVSTTASRREL